jgi:hypothetical protein
MHPRFGVEGGENDVEEVREFFETLFELGWLKDGLKPENKPVISFEVKPMAGENSSLVLADSIRVFKTAWGLLKN